MKIIPPGPPNPTPLSGTLVGLGWPVGEGVPGPRVAVAVAVGALGALVGAGAQVAVGHAPLVGLGGTQVLPGVSWAHVGEGLGVGVSVGVLVGVLVGWVGDGVRVGVFVPVGEGVNVGVFVATITVNGAKADRVPSRAPTWWTPWVALAATVKYPSKYPSGRDVMGCSGPICAPSQYRLIVRLAMKLYPWTRTRVPPGPWLGVSTMAGPGVGEGRTVGSGVPCIPNGVLVGGGSPVVMVNVAVAVS
jgi:hypothetical protein